MQTSSTIQTSAEHAAIAAALVLIGDGITAADLAAGFTRMDAARTIEGSTAILAHLAQLGLVVHTAGGGADNPRYVLTTLGRRHANAIMAVRPEIMAELEELERLRTDLLASIAHEVRTPLTAVRTAAGLLLDPRLSPASVEREQLLRTIAQSAERMQQLVTDVLDLVRFWAGAFRLQVRRFDARTLAREAADAIEPLLRTREQHLELVLPPARVWVYGDRRRLEQVLTNLLSNATKFSPNGTALRLAVDRRGDEVCWSVIDRGRGIPAEDQPRLFERFFTAASDAPGRNPGAGLGLPISLAIAYAHGGTIDVESAVARGSTFTLRVPVSGPTSRDEP